MDLLCSLLWRRPLVSLQLRVISATSGAITGSAVLAIAPPTLTIAIEGQVPADFSVSNAMRMLYGNFDPSTQTSVSALPAGAEKNSSFQSAKAIEVRAFFTGGADDSGASKVFLGTYAVPLPDGFACHGCAPVIGMAAFIRTGGSWAIESSTKTAVFSGQWGKPPDAHILRIGSDHVGVKLETAFTGQGAFTIGVSILVPWRGEIREAFDAIVAEGNGGGAAKRGCCPALKATETSLS